MQTTHTTIDGSQVSIDGPLDLSMPFTSYAAWSTDRTTLDFGAGNLSFSEGAIRRLGSVRFDEEYTYQSGRLRLGYDVLVDQDSGHAGIRRWAVWEADSHSMYTGLGDIDGGTMLALMDRFTIQETPAGVSLTPKDAAATRPTELQQYPRLYKIVPRVGLLDVHQLSDAYSRSVPNWKGQPVRGGDLYRLDSVDLDDGRVQPRLALVGNTAFTTIEVDPDASEDAYLGQVSELAVEWGKAS